MSVAVQDLLSSDAFLSLLLTLCLLMLGFKLAPFNFRSLRKLSDVSHDLSLRSLMNQSERAIAAFHYYEKLSLSETEIMQARYAKISRKHKRIGYELGYPRKLAQLAEVTKKNALVTTAIASLAVDKGTNMNDLCYPSYEELAKVREVLRHIVRDWSEEGREERAVTFAPILKELGSIETVQRSSLKVLVPGSGLGRLAWEISKLGNHTFAFRPIFGINDGNRF